MARKKTKNTVLNLRPHSHTGKRLKHGHTSYHGLALVLISAGLVLSLTFSLSAKARAATDTAATQALAPQPHFAAQISLPAVGTTYTSNPIQAVGVCETATPTNTIRVYSNDLFVGSTTCDEKGQFSMLMDIFDGQNRILARTFNFQGLEGPASNQVVVNYTEQTLPQPKSKLQTKSPAIPVNTPPRFHLTSAITSLLFTKGKSFDANFTILNGQPPYAVHINWDDGQEELLTFSTAQEVTIGHTYIQEGAYKIKIEATDSQRREAVMSLAAVSTLPNLGSTNVIGGHNLSNYSLSLIVLISYCLICLIVMSFWLGQRRGRVGTLRLRM
ncbi:MAG: hypothetical protein JWS12_139 [Candidatus Saccharibacteria bacterium]|nr:hypothetical protein [Candidatus Saccharibacteria bacterium]